MRGYFRHALGLTSISTGKISSLPMSMHRLSTILLRSLKAAKLPVGPTLPRPGPMLDRVATTAVKLVSKEKPSSDTTTVARIRIRK